MQPLDPDIAAEYAARHCTVCAGPSTECADNPAYLTPSPAASGCTAAGNLGRDNGPSSVAPVSHAKPRCWLIAGTAFVLVALVMVVAL